MGSSTVVTPGADQAAATAALCIDELRHGAVVPSSNGLPPVVA